MHIVIIIIFVQTSNLKQIGSQSIKVPLGLVLNTIMGILRGWLLALKLHFLSNTFLYGSPELMQDLGPMSRNYKLKTETND